jgi:hypothetical protein
MGPYTATIRRGPPVVNARHPPEQIVAEESNRLERPQTSMTLASGASKDTSARTLLVVVPGRWCPYVCS